MKINLKKVLPSELSSYSGYRIVRIATAFYLLVMIARSSIHLFASDGGAKSIAGIDISVAGGDNIIAIFHQWGATQLLLALFLTLLFIRYPATKAPKAATGAKWVGVSYRIDGFKVP